MFTRKILLSNIEQKMWHFCNLICLFIWNLMMDPLKYLYFMSTCPPYQRWSPDYPKSGFTQTIWLIENQGLTERSLFRGTFRRMFRYFWWVRCSVIQWGNRGRWKGTSIFFHFSDFLKKNLHIFYLNKKFNFQEN